MPTGKITREALSVTMATVRAQFKEEIGTLQKTKDRPMGLGKKQIDDLIAGHDDGMRNIITALRAAGVLEVEES